MRLLVIAAHTALRRALEQALRDDGHIVESLPELMAADDRQQVARHDLLIVDLLRPEQNVLSLLRRWRQMCRGTPILGLITPSPERAGSDRPDLGADDYLTVPFGVDDLYRRVRDAISPRDPASRVRPASYRAPTEKTRLPVAS